MIEIRMFRGAVGREEADAIADLYGPSDRKYADAGFVRHQFADNPFGWSLHAFAYDGRRAIGHCALLPLPARIGSDITAAGKFEALAVRPDHQSSTLPDGRLVGIALLAELYTQAAEAGFTVLQDLAQPELGLMHRMHGARRVPVPWQTLVGVGALKTLRTLSAGRAIAGSALACGQRGVQLLSSPVVGRAVVRAANAADEPPQRNDPAPGTWTIEAADMWEWLTGSGLLAWVDEPSGGRSLVRLPGPSAQAAELLDWRPGERRLAGAIATIAAVARIGRAARSIRIANPSDDDGLQRAARLLGFVTARDPLMLYVKSLRADFDATRAAPTPYFFATF